MTQLSFLPAVARRTACACGRCGVWWYVPPADPRLKYSPHHARRAGHVLVARHRLPETVTCPGCGTQFTNLPLPGRARTVYSPRCRTRVYRATA